MRISSQQMYSSALGNMLTQQSDLLKTQQQVSTGKRFQYAADNPVGALNSATLQRSIDRLAQYDKNASVVQTRLSLEETSVTGAINILQRVRELVVGANNGAQSDESRQNTAKEIREQVKALVQLANSQDGSGRYLFGGYNNDKALYQVDGAGNVSSAAKSLTGSVASITDFATPIAAGSLSINGVSLGAIPAAASADDRAVQLAAAVNAVSSSTGVSTSFVSGDAQLTLSSTVSFTLLSPGQATTSLSSFDPHWVRQVEISPGRSIPDGDSLLGLFEQALRDPTNPSAGVLNAFDVLSGIALELETPIGQSPRPTDPTADSSITLSDRLSDSLGTLDALLGHFIDTRSAVGVRLNALDQQIALNAESAFQLTQLKSDNEDVDLAETYSKLSLQLTGLEAAQKAFVQSQGLNLFKFL